MKKIIIATVAAILHSVSPVLAQVTISGLPNATTPLVGTELVPLVQSGITRKATVSDIISAAGTITANTTLTNGFSAGNILMSDGSKIQIANVANIGTSLAIGGATIGGNAFAITGSAAISSTLTSAAHTITSASANALAVGLNGATNPAFNVDASTGSQVAGLNVKGAVHNGTVAVAVTDSSGAANLTINALSTGTIGIGSVSTGAVTITPAAVFGAGITAASLATPSSNIAGSLCATSGGVVLYNSGANCYVGTAVSVTIGTTTVASGSDTKILYQNGASPTGVLGEYAISGSGSVVMTAGAALTGVTGLGIRDTSAGFDVTIVATSSVALTTGRTLTLDMVNAAHTLKFGGNLTLANNFTTAGNFDTTITSTNTTNSTLPAGTHTLAGLDVAQSWTATQTLETVIAGTTNTYDIGTSATIAAFRTVYAGTSFVGPTGSFTTAAVTPILRPASDSTTAFQVTKADGTTRIMDFDTTNARVGINKTPGSFDLDVNGATNAGGGLTVATSFTATNLVANAALAQMAAATIKINATSGTANATDSTIQGLTNLAAPDASLDYLLIYDHAAGTIKSVTPGAIAGSVVAGVSSLGNATSDTTLTIAGTGSGPWTGVVTAALNLAKANTWTGDFTLSGASLIISGNISAAAWTTNGIRIKGTPGTLTDTSSSGTVATAYTDVLGGNTIAASSSTTYTNYVTQYVKDPVAGTNVTLTNKWAIGGDSLRIGTSNQLTISNAGLLTVPGTANFTGTFQVGGNAMTFPGSAATLASLTLADQTLSGGANVTSGNLGTKTTGTTTIDCGTVPLQYLTNGGAFTLAAPSNDGSCIVQVTNNGSAGTITFSGFTVGSSTGSALDTTNAHKFMISIARVNGSSVYNVLAQQ